MEDLFPALPEDISAIPDEELKTLVSDHESAKDLIAEENAEFLKDLAAEEILAQLEKGGNQYQLLLAETELRERAHENYLSKKQDTLKAFEPAEEEPAPDEPSEPDPEPDSDKAEELEVVAEAEAITEEAVEEKELVTASVADTTLVPVTTASSSTSMPTVRFSRTPPAAKADRIPQPEPEVQGAALVASGEFSIDRSGALDGMGLGELVRDACAHYGPMPKVDPVGKYRFGGPETKIAKATYDFPEDRELTGDRDQDRQKVEAIVAASFPGGIGQYSLTASGGLCAPAEPFYSLVNFASQAEPVWDSLPVFAARRGAVNVPESGTIGDITTAISSISEANDALGGTFATKSCQSLSCPSYTETAVNIIAHCREYGNLNARSWPELIANQNELTMAAVAQTSEDFILERIKALSVNVSSGAATLSALTYLVDAIAKSMFGIRGRLRMPNDARFRALLPIVMLDMLLVDAVQNGFDRYKTRGELDSFLRSTGIDPIYYMDGDFAAGDKMIPDAAQGAGTLESWPNTFQWALFPEGAFLGIDMGVLELGIVRDSELNSTNDFQVFGERFRNVVRIAPAQSCYWETTTLCAVGSFPGAGTTRTCES